MPVTRIDNATVWTGISASTGVRVLDAIAFDEDRIIALGDEARAVDAEVVLEADGQFVGPAFRDGHAHPMFAGIEDALAPVRGKDSVDAMAAAVADWAATHADEVWVRGEGFDASVAPGGVFEASWLDAVVPDRPVVLRASDYHTVWVNSEALNRVGYSAETPDPRDGEILRGSGGAPIGTLREWGAWRPVYELLPPRTEVQNVQAVRSATQRLAASGITWVQDAWVEPREAEAWMAAMGTGQIPVRADLALWCDPHAWRNQLDHFVAAREQAAGCAAGQLSATTVKFFADGVIESGTGALLAPYHDRANSRGLLNWEAGELASAVAAVVALGFAPHIHAIGDAAVRMALDAIEHAQRLHGRRAARATIAHVQLVDGSDIDRFHELGVIANAEPFWAQRDGCQLHLTAPRLGPERTERQYQLRSIIDSGATLSFGSDWPVTTQHPLDGIEVAVTRRGSVDEEPLVAEQAISVEEALTAYTSAVAEQAGDPWGGILRPGYRSDVVLLDRDPRRVAPDHISSIEVVGTWCDGVRTFGG